MIKSTTTLIIFLLSFFTVSNLLAVDVPRAEKGILDLRSLDSIELLNLNGEWAFYWEKLLMPDEIITGEEDCFGEVPAYWYEYKDEIPHIKRHGFATYHLSVLLPPGSAFLCLEIPVFDASGTLYVNEHVVSTQGKPGKDMASTIPGYSPRTYRFHNIGDTLNITIQVANFHHRNGGVWKELYLGDPQVINNKAESAKLISFMMMGIMFGTFILFMVFFLIEKKNYVFLAFALTALGFLFRMFHSGLYPLTDLYLQDWNWTIRFEYLGAYAAAGFFLAYMHNLMPTKRMAQVAKIILYLFLLLSIVVVFTKPAIFSYTVFVPMIVGGLTLLYYLTRSFFGMLKKNLKQTAFFITLLVLLLALINDILVAMSKSPFNSNYISSLAFLTIIVVQAAMLLFDWSQNYRERIEMHNELQYINRNLESIIDERTGELNKMNEDLKETLENKSRIYSIIAHDLKSPMASLSQYSDLLMLEFKGTKNEKLISEFQRLSNGSVHLIDNLLHWGGRQGRKISYDPTTFTLAKTINELTILYKGQLKEKDIRLNMHIPVDIRVHCDQTLLMITMRNLLNNAVKFTPEHGIIEIIAGELKNKVLISVKDNGIGMEEDFINDILANKAHSTEGTSGEKGTGLGMVVVNDLVKINKGSLQIESKPGKGTTMSFSLPGKP